MVHPYHGIVHSSKKEKLLIHSTTYMNLQGIILSEKPLPKDYILYDPIYKTFLK